MTEPLRIIYICCCLHFDNEEYLYYLFKFGLVVLGKFTIFHHAEGNTNVSLDWK